MTKDTEKRKVVTTLRDESLDAIVGGIDIAGLRQTILEVCGNVSEGPVKKCINAIDKKADTDTIMKLFYEACSIFPSLLTEAKLFL